MLGRLGVSVSGSTTWASSLGWPEAPAGVGCLLSEGPDARTDSSKGMETVEDWAEIAAALGHTNPALYETPGGRFFITCDCGWKSTTRRTVEDALGAGVHHAKLDVKKFRSNGRVLPRQNPFLVGKNVPR